jgi:hypothetical protein
MSLSAAHQIGVKGKDNMSNTARKARKRAGIKFSKPARIATPLEDRSIPAVTDKNGRVKGPDVTHMSNRAVMRLARMIQARDMHKVEEPAAEKPKRKSRAKKAVEA